MVKCSNCGKKLGMVGRYYHHTFGKRWLFCSECYNEIEKTGSPYLDKLQKRYFNNKK